MHLFDTHCHLDMDAFAADRDDVLARSRAVGVKRMLIPGVKARDWQALLDLCRREDGLYPALGLHPVFLEEHQTGDVLHLERLLANSPDVIAVGEIGLDFYLPTLDREQQQYLFDAQLTLARNAGLPVILHVRKAHDAVLSSLKKIPVEGGIVHAFNGSFDQAQRYIDMGFKLGFGGMLTFDNAHKLQRLARELPLESIVLETDSPDMSGVAYRGQRNSPEYLPEYFSALAELRQEPPAQVIEQVWCNSLTILKA